MHFQIFFGASCRKEVDLICRIKLCFQNDFAKGEIS